MDNEHNDMENPKIIREENGDKCCGNFKCCGGKKMDFSCNNQNAIYGIGLIGAMVYFISTSHGFASILLGVLKAFIWPALVVFQLMKFLGI